MRQAGDLSRLASLARVQAMVHAEAQRGFILKQAELEAACGRESTAFDEREGSVAVWRSLLERPDPHPQLLGMAGGTILRAEAALAATSLDTSIAEGRRDAASSALAHELGIDLALKRTLARQRRKVRMKLDEVRSSEIVSLLLARSA